MQLSSLQVINLRNLCSVDLCLNSHINIFFGKNGSGKTSLLEAINVLTSGRSFRANKPGQIIRFGEKSCIISGTVSTKTFQNPQNLPDTTNSAIITSAHPRFESPIRLGVERFLTGSPKIRLAEQDCQSIAQLARVLPVQLINTDSYDILEASPQMRRQFLDWVMFHVEHSFYETWQRFKRALAQRNAALKNYKNLNSSDIRVWDKEFVETGMALDMARRDVLRQILPVFLETLEGLISLKSEVEIKYSRGWEEKEKVKETETEKDEGVGLLEALERSFNRDREWGYTTIGPQRADLEFMLGGVLVKNVLSRGQLKLFVCALLMARAVLLYQKTGRRCVFMVDDLNSELDKESGAVLIEALCNWGGQVLITTIENDPLATKLQDMDHAMFHVEHGKIYKN